MELQDQFITSDPPGWLPVSIYFLVFVVFKQIQLRLFSLNQVWLISERQLVNADGELSCQSGFIYSRPFWDHANKHSWVEGGLSAPHHHPPPLSGWVKSGLQLPFQRDAGPAIIFWQITARNVTAGFPQSGVRHITHFYDDWCPTISITNEIPP